MEARIGLIDDDENIRDFSRHCSVELFRRMQSFGLPDHHAVLFLTGHGNIPLAVEAIENGATDFLERPFSDNSLVERVIMSMIHGESVFAESSRLLGLRSHLSSREQEIAEYIVNGSTERRASPAAADRRSSTPIESANSTPEHSPIDESQRQAIGYKTETHRRRAHDGLDRV